MTMRELCIRLVDFEISVTASGSLQIGPKAMLTDELREAIRTHKAAILDELEWIQTERWRREWDAIEPHYLGWQARQEWLATMPGSH